MKEKLKIIENAWKIFCEYYENIKKIRRKNIRLILCDNKFTIKHLTFII